MNFVRKFWLQVALTLAAFGLGCARDAQDGTIGWGLLIFGSMVAAAGFFGGSFIASRVAAKHE